MTAIVCIAKNEENYIQEWIKYHLKLGFDHIFVYRNNWYYAVNHSQVTEIQWDGEIKQIDAYNTFLEKNTIYKWVAFIDVDEFLCLKKHSSIQSFLYSMGEVPCIAMNWVLFGDNNLEGEDVGVLKRFTKRGPANQHIKVIVNTEFKQVFLGPHNTNSYWVTPTGHEGSGAFNTECNIDVIQLNHYFCKTKQEFQKKIDRGRADHPVKRDFQEFYASNLNEIEDTTALDFYRLPFISCKCTTYGRVNFLEEALESFLKQDYKGRKELVIINDYPLQILQFEHPEVRIINTNSFRSISEKENFAVQQCNGDLIAVFDDDDIAMPWHLTEIAEKMEDNDLIRWENGVYYNEPDITSITYIGNSGMVYTKEAWERIGKFPLENAGYDSTFTQRMEREGKVKKVKLNKPSWFYCWGGRGYHQSGKGYDKPGQPNIIERHSMYIEQQRASGKIPTGIIKLYPHWNKDYIKLLEEHVTT